MGLEQLSVFPQFFDLVLGRRYAESSRFLELRIDSMSFDRSEKSGVILQAESLQSPDFSREVSDAVGQTMGQ